jgi:hypothetical protein
MIEMCFIFTFSKLKAVRDITYEMRILHKKINVLFLFIFELLIKTSFTFSLGHENE